MSCNNGYIVGYYRETESAMIAAPKRVMIPTAVFSPAPVLLWLGLAAPTPALVEDLAEDPDPEAEDEADPELADPEAEAEELAEADDPDPRDASS